MSDDRKDKAGENREGAAHALNRSGGLVIPSVTIVRPSTGNRERTGGKEKERPQGYTKRRMHDLVSVCVTSSVNA